MRFLLTETFFWELDGMPMLFFHNEFVNFAVL